MLRKQVSPRAIALAIVLILGAVQLVYWRLLVYRPPNPGPMGGAPAGALPPPQELAMGLEEVVVDTLAGDTPGYADGPGWKAQFCGPNALAIAADGAVLVADSRNHRIRHVTRTGMVSTLAGSGPTSGSGGKAVGPANQARFSFPSGVAVGPDGTIYISDTGNARICRLRDGAVTELTPAAGSLKAPATLTFDGGRLWVLDAVGAVIRTVDLSGAVTTPNPAPQHIQVALGARPGGKLKLAAWSEPWDAPGQTSFTVGRRSAASERPGLPVVVADSDLQVLLVDRQDGPPALLAGRVTPGPPSQTTLDGRGDRAGFGVPCATQTSPDGTVYVAEYEGHRIRKVRLPDWLREGQYTAPERRGRWRRRRGD